MCVHVYVCVRVYICVCAFMCMSVPEHTLVDQRGKSVYLPHLCEGVSAYVCMSLCV